MKRPPRASAVDEHFPRERRFIFLSVFVSCFIVFSSSAHIASCGLVPAFPDADEQVPSERPRQPGNCLALSTYQRVCEKGSRLLAQSPPRQQWGEAACGARGCRRKMSHQPSSSPRYLSGPFPWQPPRRASGTQSMLRPFVTVPFPSLPCAVHHAHPRNGPHLNSGRPTGRGGLPALRKTLPATVAQGPFLCFWRMTAKVAGSLFASL